MTNFAIIATYTAEDGLDDLEQRGPFETLADAQEVFDAYLLWADYRDVQMWDTTSNTRVA